MLGYRRTVFVSPSKQNSRRQMTDFLQLRPALQRISTPFGCFRQAKMHFTIKTTWKIFARNTCMHPSSHGVALMMSQETRAKFVNGQHSSLSAPTSSLRFGTPSDGSVNVNTSIETGSDAPKSDVWEASLSSPTNLPSSASSPPSSLKRPKSGKPVSSASPT